MRAKHIRAGRPVAIAAALAVVTLALGSTATIAVSATGPEPPINDNYLDSLNLNKPGTPLNRVDTLTDTRNTTNATVQSDIFDPPSHGGPPELTGCEGVSEGKTIWYDFYPDANGIMRVRTSATFGTVMAVMPYDPKTLLPENNQRMCAVNEPTKAGELFDNVQAGKSYTVQIGGVDEAGGELEVLFDYLVQLKPLQAEATLTAQPLSSGVRVLSLAVTAPTKARVEVRCTRGCSPQTQTGRSVGFSHLRDAVLPDGAVLKIYATAKNRIGTYIEYRIGRGRFSKVQRCLQPGSKRPETCE
ncbi:MAG TPA: hypothetical protein VED41_13605 [Solirubrobacteraceae bacterium]|nr:hypothetical protein [Solirubrobacteraceae bacterium]